MKNSLKQTVVRGLVVTMLPLVITGCHREPGSTYLHQAADVSVTGCSGNPYLTKYGCSIDRIQAAAENGNPDAQYALGYMYYYGIDTAKDQQTAQLWIQRAAAQGQPLAKKAWSLIHSGSAFDDLHQAASQSLTQASQQGSTIEYQPSENVEKLNATQHDEPITNHLPAYNPNQASGSSSPVVDAGSDESSAQKNYSQHTNSKAAQRSEKNLADASSVAQKYHAINDPRLMSDAKPEVAAMNASGQTSMNSTSATAQSYTIQLLASDKVNDITSYVLDHKLGHTAQYYRTEMHGKPWYMLTYGRYSSEQHAHFALTQLPQDLTRHHPWVKSFATVQKEVRTQEVA